MICKHFNLSFLELQKNFTLAEYYVLLAEALDAEELEEYSQHAMTINAALAYHAPKKIHKWKWGSIDKAGTIGLDPATGKISMNDTFTGLLTQLGGQVAQGSADEYIKATGRPVAYRAPDGSIVDINGNPIQRTPDHIILRLPTEVN